MPVQISATGGSKCKDIKMKQSYREVISGPLTYGGETLSAREWARKVNLPHMTFIARLQRGWTLGEALGFEERPPKPGEQEPDLVYEALTVIRGEYYRLQAENQVLRQERDEAISTLRSAAETLTARLGKNSD